MMTALTDEPHCLSCVHPRSKHGGCEHHGACCNVPECTCFSFTEPIETAETDRPPRIVARGITLTAMAREQLRIEVVGEGGLFLSSITLASRDQARELRDALDLFLRGGS